MLLENQLFLLSSKEIVEIIEKVLESRFEFEEDLADASNSHSKVPRSLRNDKDECKDG